jgi:hypothetical protein
MQQIPRFARDDKLAGDPDRSGLAIQTAERLDAKPDRLPPVFPFKE